MTTTEITTTNVHPELTRLTVGLVRSVANHLTMTSDDRCELEHFAFAAGRAKKLAELLQAEPAIDGSFEMLPVALTEITDLIDDVWEYREFQETDPHDLQDLLVAYRIIAERNGVQDFSGLEPVEQWIKNETEQDDEN